MDELERLLQEKLIYLQRYVHFKIHNKHDAEDNCGNDVKKEFCIIIIF